jgi:hypothetical protein
MKRLPEAVAAAQAALVKFNDPPRLFLQGDELVKLKCGGERAAKTSRVSMADLQGDLAFAARWLEQTEKGVKPIYPPTLLVHALIQRAAQWAPPLRQVIHVPVFGTEWKLLQEPGYHRGDQVYSGINHAPVDPVPETPDGQLVEEARRLITGDSWDSSHF